MALELPDVVCTCKLDERQAAVDHEAGLYNHQPVRLWHTDRCDVALRIELARTIRKIEELDATQMLPDPVLDRMRAAELGDLIALRDNLWTRLDSTGQGAAPSGSWYDGESQVTRQPKTRRVLGAQPKGNG